MKSTKKNIHPIWGIRNPLPQPFVNESHKPIQKQINQPRFKNQKHEFHITSVHGYNKK